VAEAAEAAEAAVRGADGDDEARRLALTHAAKGRARKRPRDAAALPVASRAGPREPTALRLSGAISEAALVRAMGSAARRAGAVAATA